MVLRRACSIGMSRGLDLDSYPTLADMPGLRPVCFSMQPDAGAGRVPQPRSDPRLRRPARRDARRGPRLSRRAPGASVERADHLGPERLERRGRREVGEPHVEAIDPALAHGREVVDHLAARPPTTRVCVAEATARRLLDRRRGRRPGARTRTSAAPRRGRSPADGRMSSSRSSWWMGTFHQSACAATSSIVRFPVPPMTIGIFAERRRHLPRRCRAGSTGRRSRTPHRTRARAGCRASRTTAAPARVPRSATRRTS